MICVKVDWVVLTPKHDRFKLRFGNLGERLVSIIFTKAYYYDYKKQNLVEVVGVEKISCNLLKKHLSKREKNEN
ncbi:hypothetical protein [Helicobacter pylori]|uniref:hypothetical protein n=1 Tax=Helicobacter pylori TaxID=210 RepID=UPI001E2F390D|nr:hypothetical protein [Helicobacter pylori]